MEARYKIRGMVKQNRRGKRMEKTRGKMEEGAETRGRSEVERREMQVERKGELRNKIERRDRREGEKA